MKRFRFTLQSTIAAIAFLAAASTAQAQTSSLTFVSQPGDYIGQGNTYSFSDVSSAISTDNRNIGISINTSEHWFTLNLTAPEGQQLVPGVYEGAARYPYQAANQPGLSLSGDGRGCSTLTGRFEVTEAVYGPLGTIVRFAANFEQSCDGFMPPLFGQVSITNPEPVPALTVDVAVNQHGTVRRVNGLAIITGTVKCSRSATVQITGHATQRVNHVSVAQGGLYASTSCNTTPTTWTVSVGSVSLAPFQSGQAQVDVTARAGDPTTNANASDTESAVTNLVPVQK